MGFKTTGVLLVVVGVLALLMFVTGEPPGQPASSWCCANRRVAAKGPFRLTSKVLSHADHSAPSMGPK